MDKEKRAKYLDERRTLPIWPHKAKLLELIRNNPFVVIVSSTGSGKTTQIPQFLLDSGMAATGMIAITQPRRIAAISVAERVSDETGAVSLSTGKVGYKVRFDNSTIPEQTQICYLTEGSLLREAEMLPDLRQYSIVILDEAHERSVNMEFLFGVLKRASSIRENSKHPLKVIVMSATIDPEPYIKYFGEDQTHAVYIDGRGHGLSIRSIKEPITDYVMQAASTCVHVNIASADIPDRGILIFLSGEDEIYQCIHLIKHINRSHEEKDKKSYPIDVYPLFAALSQAEQKRAVGAARAGARKVIVATNIAETSITIPGICIVIDSGKVKTPEYDSATGIERLRVNWITKSQAAQRAGRANRERKGLVFRLYTDEEYENNMASFPPSQMITTPTADILLNLFALGIRDLETFPWLERPDTKAIKSGVDLLHRLGAITYPSTSLSNGYLNGLSNFCNSIPRQVTLTKEGQLMQHFPLSPRMSRVILSSAKYNCLVEVLTIISMLFVSPVFHVPQDKREEFNDISKRFHHPDGDLIRLLLVFRSYSKISDVKSNDSNSNSIATGSSHLPQSKRRLLWCRENFLILNRLKAAIKIRSQLRELVLRSGLGPISSCGANDFTPVVKAFFEVGFRDQVASLVKNTSINGVIEGGNNPHYRKRCTLRTSEGNFSVCLSIHPESTLYVPAVVGKNPPQALLYIEAVDMGLSDANDRVIMRHISRLPSEWLIDEEQLTDQDDDTPSVSCASNTTTSSSQMNGGDLSPKFLSKRQKRKLKKAAQRAKRMKVEVEKTCSSKPE
nr:ATP dependent RNA helicase DHX33 [Hymenolepis microstoma]